MAQRNGLKDREWLAYPGNPMGQIHSSMFQRVDAKRDARLRRLAAEQYPERT